MATCDNANKSLLVLQTCQLTFLRFIELWETSCIHLSNKIMIGVSYLQLPSSKDPSLGSVVITEVWNYPGQEEGDDDTGSWRRDLKRSRGSSSKLDQHQTEVCEVSARLWSYTAGGRYGPCHGPCSSNMWDMPRWARREQGRLFAGSCRRAPSAHSHLSCMTDVWYNSEFLTGIFDASSL